MTDPTNPTTPERPDPTDRQDLHTSLGEVVRREDLDRAAGTPGRFRREDPSVAGYEGVRLAKAALAGDQAALDAFHHLAGLVLPRVTEHSEENAVRLVMATTSSAYHGQDRPAFQASNQGGHDSTCIDAAELVTWIISPEGRAALTHRGVTIPEPATDDSGIERECCVGMMEVCEEVAVMLNQLGMVAGGRNRQAFDDAATSVRALVRATAGRLGMEPGLGSEPGTEQNA